MQKMYHYTSEFHWPSIDEVGAIRTTESNVSMTTDGAGPDVVWLTNQVFTTPPPYLKSAVDKTAVRIQVTVPREEIHRADRWLRSHGASEDWIATLEHAGGARASTWFVVERPIVRSEWVAVLHRNSRANKAAHDALGPALKAYAARD